MKIVHLNHAEADGISEGKFAGVCETYLLYSYIFSIQIVALMMLCHLLPDTRISVDTSHIIVFIPVIISIGVVVVLVFVGVC